jgi:hypothetical protein
LELDEAAITKALGADQAALVITAARMGLAYGSKRERVVHATLCRPERAQ